MFVNSQIFSSPGNEEKDNIQIIQLIDYIIKHLKLLNLLYGSQRRKTCQTKKMTFYQPLSSVFNLGEYRRRVTQMYKNHNFFRSDNEEAMALRQRCALDALEDVCEWLENEAGEVAVSA